MATKSSLLTHSLFEVATLLQKDINPIGVVLTNVIHSANCLQASFTILCILTWSCDYCLFYIFLWLSEFHEAFFVGLFNQFNPPIIQYWRMSSFPLKLLWKTLPRSSQFFIVNLSNHLAFSVETHFLDLNHFRKYNLNNFISTNSLHSPQFLLFCWNITSTTPNIWKYFCKLSERLLF
jgi:hypothetical protein